MKILGIDTSTNIMGLSIVEENKILVNCMLQKPGITHSSSLIPFLKNMLDFQGIELKDLAGIAVSVGPGSFTGLRIGLSTAKGIAFALSLPMVGINSLEAYSAKYMNLQGILCPIIKARKDEYYFTFYNNEKDKRLLRIEEYQCDNWLNIREKINKLKQQVYIMGDSLEDLLSFEKKADQYKAIHFIFQKQDPPGAAIIALMGEEKIKEKEYDDLFQIVPFYIGKSLAERIKK
ncbi:MAG: tRNA (adenosine(37)-N6)-threonylcarbamoyltransferase complex dimerization subunit type 1 TsaB [Atribacterota bacterium]|nr:tRNA (adenosine(37)-N6)-threonylcarbamoyltransferase complex dimerization subunit type 1 TsaB [Atribacterota bacterium]